MISSHLSIPIAPSLGIYGPTWRDTFTYEPLPLDPATYHKALPIIAGKAPLCADPQLVHPNQLLLNIGYLTIKDPPTNPISLHNTEVGWGESLLWADEGGSFTLNCRGRQRDGAICIINYYSMRYRLSRGVANRLMPIMGEVEVVIPQERWNDCNGVPPDFIVMRDGYYFTDLIGMAALITPPDEELLSKMAIGRLRNA